MTPNALTYERLVGRISAWPHPRSSSNATHALSILSQAAELAIDNGGCTILVSGEAGVGKTTLVNAVAGVSSHRVLRRRVRAAVHRAPLGPFVDIAAVLPEPLASTITGGGRAHAALADLLDELTVRPSIVIIEDVHWADKASLDLIALLGRRMSQTASLLVVTFRDDELAIDHPLRHTLSALVGRPGAERIRLQPLSIDGVARLIGRDRQHAQQMYQRTGGNPFFITEVMAEPDEALPASVADAVLGRIARLEQPERQLLEALSIVPGLIPTNLVEVLGGSNADQLDRLFDSGMLVRSCNDIAFRHEITRETVAATVGPLRTVELHRMAMEALIAGGADPAIIAHHADAAGDVEAVRRFAARLPMQQFEWGLIARLRLSTAGLFALAIRTPCSRQSCSSSEGTRPCSAIASTSRSRGWNEGCPFVAISATPAGCRLPS